MSHTSQDVFDLHGKRVLITGASRGIGQAIAAGFAGRGAHVVGVARSVDGLAETASLCDGSAGSFSALPADLRSPESIAAVVDQQALDQMRPLGASEAHREVDEASLRAAVGGDDVLPELTAEGEHPTSMHRWAAQGGHPRA